jgi:serpin B
MAENAVTRIERRMTTSVTKKILAEGGDGVFSPTGLGIAAAVVLSMSSETTRDEVCIALGVPPMDELVFLLAHQEVHRALSIKKEDVTLNIVNGLFVKGPVIESYGRMCKTFFKATTFQLHGKESVNAWVEEKTEGKIPNLLDADPTASVFVNVIYFKGVFDVAFPKLETKCKPFYCDYTAEEPGAPTLVPTMHKTETVKYISCHLGKVVELPYGDGTYALLIMLPDKDLGLAACVNLLMSEWTNLLAAMTPMKVEMEVPKFDLKFDFDASDVFKTEGIKEAFVEGSAKLGRLTQDGSCYVEKVVQSATFSLDEEGVEAAAATAVLTGCRGGGGRRKEVQYFTVNRPAMYMVVQKDVDAMLFAALVSHPVPVVAKADAGDV